MEKPHLFLAKGWLIGYAITQFLYIIVYWFTIDTYYNLHRQLFTIIRIYYDDNYIFSTFANVFYHYQTINKSVTYTYNVFRYLGVHIHRFKIHNSIQSSIWISSYFICTTTHKFYIEKIACAKFFIKNVLEIGCFVYINWFPSQSTVDLTRSEFKCFCVRFTLIIGVFAYVSITLTII